jgi:hypothetical protein
LPEIRVGIGTRALTGGGVLRRVNVERVDKRHRADADDEHS